MKLKPVKIIFPMFLIVLLTFLYLFNFSLEEQKVIKVQRIRSTDSPKAAPQSVKDRDQYFFNMLRDPKTNVIPSDVVRSEMKFIEKERSRRLSKTSASNVDNWKEAGPNDVGGRTRAIGIDVRDPKIVLAGGVSGGIWKTTDKGSTWELKFTTSQVLSVSSITQDTRAGHEDTWYAATGEFIGNSATKTGAAFRGAGLYKSIDNGETWELLPKEDDVTLWDHPLDYVSKVSVNPVTGSILIASNGFGIFKSTNEGSTFQNILSDNNRYCELDVAADGTIIAALSENSVSTSVQKVGVWMSKDDGVNWTDVTPVDYPVGTTYGRAVAAIAPSNTNLCYVLVEVDDDNHDHRLFKINLASKTSEDLTAKLPDFDGSGVYTSQGGYDMLIAVKPDNENLVIIGGTNLYRTFDGFATPLTADIDNQWIGGYDPEGGTYLGSHPDIHSFAFEKGDTLGKMWLGTDGGLSYTTSISGKKGVNYSLSPFQLKNNGYNVTQVYHISIPNKSSDGRILAGCQDNGTPNFTFDGTATSVSQDVSSGDGSYSYFGSSFAYVSTQNGSIIQLGYINGEIPNIFKSTAGVSYSFVHPPESIGATGQQFINPFVINPQNENIMFYPAGLSMWKNTKLSAMPRGGGWDGQSDNWEKIEKMDLPAGYSYSSVNISTDNSSHVLYAAAFNSSNKPIIYRLDNAVISTNSPVNISIPDLPVGSYIDEIAVNPKNSNEILVAATNYNIVGLYHSSDGGATYEAVEGNLEGDGGKGPSMRSVAIVRTSGGNLYLVGTSVGLFSTSQLNGSNTEWIQEGPDVIGNVVVESIATRTADNYIAIGTHGRGVFTGTAKDVSVAVKQINKLPTSYTLSQNYPNPFNPTTKIRYSVPLASNVSLKIFNTNGELINEIVNQYQPAGTFEADWNGTNKHGVKVASGAYIYTLRAGDFVQSKKMLLLK